MNGIRERIGNAIGQVWAPAIAAISKARDARMFHPMGLTFAARADALGPLGERLEGRVLARCSAALWKRPIEHFDVLGIALRFRRGEGDPLDEQARRGDQDLLFATIISPLTMFASPLTTNAHDYLANRYWAVSPFSIDGRRVKFRLSPSGPREGEGRRNERLRAAVANDVADLILEARPTMQRGWEPVAQITLEQELELDQAALRFDPFRTGAGIQPVGLVHAIRRAAYAASQDARPDRTDG
jgi:hypothetical protein